jgi:hypothetical protein
MMGDEVNSPSGTVTAVGFDDINMNINTEEEWGSIEMKQLR